jgi:integrase
MGRVENQTNIVRRHWHPLQLEAGVCVPALDDTGNPVMALGGGSKPVQVMAPKYPGLHALRHFFCSWCANSTKAGGLGLTLKETQVRMGHSTLAMTADRYGHLFVVDEEKQRKALAAGERALMGA